MVGGYGRQIDFGFRFLDRRNGMFQLSRLPPGVLQVCAAKPHQARCYTCMEEDRCGWSTWDGYKVKPGVALNGVGPRSDTLSSLPVYLNRLVVQFLGRFCTSTHERFINTGELKDYCNYCQKWARVRSRRVRAQCRRVYRSTAYGGQGSTRVRAPGLASRTHRTVLKMREFINMYTHVLI